MQAEPMISSGLSYTAMALFIVPGLIGLLGCRALLKLGPAPVAWPLRLRFVREFAWMLVPFAVIGTFGLMAAPREFLSGFGGMWPQNAPPPSPPTPVRPLSESFTQPVSTSRADESPNRPAWVNQPRTVESDGERIVLASQQYSTKEEAELELRFAAVKLVEDDLRRIQTGSFRPAIWRPLANDVMLHAVRQRYVEVADRDFGSFTHPMYRVWWQVELSPSVRTEFLPAWRRELISFRILLVATFASVLAMAAAVVVMYFRLDSLTQGLARGELKGLTGVLMAMWVVLAAGAVSQGHLW